MSRIVSPLEGRPFTGWDDSAPIAAPLALYRAKIPSEWTDYNGHMSESSYLLAFGDNSDAFFRYFGIDEAYRAQGRSLYTLETRLRHLLEAEADAEIACTLQLLALDAKRLHIFHVMQLEDGRELATCEQILIHVDMRAGRSAPMPAELFARLAAIRAAHSALAAPASVGTALGLRREARP